MMVIYSFPYTSCALDQVIVFAQVLKFAVGDGTLFEYV